EQCPASEAVRRRSARALSAMGAFRSAYALSTLLQVLAHRECGGVGGFHAQRAGDVLRRRRELILRDVQTSEYQQRGYVGLNVDRTLRLGACVPGVTAAFPDFGQAGVGGGAVGIGRERGLELLLGLRQQPLGEVIASERRVFGRALRRGQGGHAGRAELVKLEGGLAEGGLGVVTANALNRGEAAVGIEFGAGGGQGEVGAE